MHCFSCGAIATVFLKMRNTQVAGDLRPQTDNGDPCVPCPKGERLLVNPETDRCQIAVDLVGDRVRQRHQTRLVEFGAFNVKDTLPCVEMTNSQTEQFAATQTATVEQDQGPANGCRA